MASAVVLISCLIASRACGACASMIIGARTSDFEISARTCSPLVPVHRAILFSMQMSRNPAEVSARCASVSSANRKGGGAGGRSTSIVPAPVRMARTTRSNRSNLWPRRQPGAGTVPTAARGHTASEQRAIRLRRRRTAPAAHATSKRALEQPNRASASPTSKCAPATFERAISIMVGVKSTPMTRAPRAEAAAERLPVPQQMSSRSSPQRPRWCREWVRWPGPLSWRSARRRQMPSASRRIARDFLNVGIARPRGESPARNHHTRIPSI